MREAPFIQMALNFYPPKYVIMGCLCQAKKGGYSIITSAKKIADFLKLKKNQKHLNYLKKFFFERRGFNFANKNIFNKPIFTVKKKNLDLDICENILNLHI